MMMGGLSTRVLMIVALGYIMVAHVAVAAEAEEVSTPLLAASSDLVLKDFGPSGYFELPGITRVKPFWRGRKLLAACGVSDVEVNIQMMGLSNGSNHYSVEINWDLCNNSNCCMSNIHLYCPGYETVDVNSNVFKHTSGSDCVVNNGGYLAWRGRIRMQYISNIGSPQMHATSAMVTNC